VQTPIFSRKREVVLEARACRPKETSVQSGHG